MCSPPQRHVLLLLFALGATGCLYLPPLGHQFTPEAQARIVVGRTTREQAIEILGRPDLLDEPPFAVFDAMSSKGTFLLIAAAGYSLGVLPLPIKARFCTVLLRFDRRGIVRRYEVERRAGPGVEEPDAAAPTGRTLFRAPPGIRLIALIESADRRRVAIWGETTHRPCCSLWIRDLLSGGERSVAAPWFSTAVFSPDLHHAATLRREVSLTDLDTGEWLSEELPKHPHRRHPGAPSALAFGPGGRRVASGWRRGDVRVFETASGKERSWFRAGRTPVQVIAWSPAGDRLATASQLEPVRLFDARTGRLQASFTPSGQALAFSPDGSQLAINRRSHVELWQLPPPNETEAPSSSPVLENVFLLPQLVEVASADLAYSPDGRFIAASNGALAVFDRQQARVVFRLHPGWKPGGVPNPEIVSSVAFSSVGENVELLSSTRSEVRSYRLTEAAAGPVPRSGG